MKHLELHIIQSVPVACLNRDDLNSPKTAVFGGVQRARVSSQSWKRAIRELAKEIDSEEESGLFNGDRTRRMVYTLQKRLVEKGMSAIVAVAIAERVADIVETLDSKTDLEGYKRIKTVMFFSKAEYDAIADAIFQSEDVQNAIVPLESAITNLANLEETLKSCKDKDKKDELKEEQNSLTKERDKAMKAMGKILEKKAIAKAIKSAQLKDAADIALFGRMVANDPSLRIDGASMFAHILSTHKADNEIDFFSAVDDLNKGESGAGMTSTLEFNSATYYRFAALNLDDLANADHLGDAVFEDGTEDRTVETRKKVVETFLKATIQAIPSAQKTSKNANTRPDYVLGIVREKGHPIQLVNAFESAIRPSMKGFAIESINRMNQEYADLSETWGVESAFAKAVCRKSIKEQVAENLGEIETCSFDELVKGWCNMSSDECYLALRLQGPMQSWGFDSQYNRRNTGLMPTRSAIAGMCCAALGLSRGCDDEKQFLEAFSAIRMTAISIPRCFDSNRELPVRRLQDYHTVQNTRRASGGMNTDSVLTHRTYLTDSAFGVLLEGENEFLKEVASALADPKWGIWLGRKTCIPSAPVLAGLKDTFGEALSLLVGDKPLESFTRQMETETFADGRDSLPDVPVSFASGRRIFSPRRVITKQAGEK